MTVSSTSRRAKFLGNDVTTSFPFTFKVFAESDLLLVHTDAEGNETELVLDVGYSVVLNDDQDVDPGGTITYPLAGDPLADGETLVATSAIPSTQATAFGNAGRFSPTTHESAFDKVTALIQQALEKLGRALLVSVNDSGSPATLPAASARAGAYLAFDAEGDPVTSSGTGADAGLRADLAATAGSSLVAFLQDGDGAAEQSLQSKLRWMVSADDFTLAADGVTNDAAKLLKAANRAVARGVELVLDGTKTYLLGAEMTFPSGLRLRTNGATFTTDLTTTGDTYLITMGDDTVVDELNVTIPTGKRRDRCVLLDGDDIQVGRITLTSVDQQANTAAADGAVQILTGARNWVGLIRVTKWDRAVVISSTSKCTVGRIEATSYVRAVYLVDNTDLLIQSGKVSTASPNASATAGHNGVLMGCNSTDAQRDVVIENFVVEDAAEHGFRIGGPEQQSKLRFSHCSAYNCGGDGLKILGTDSGLPTAVNTQITINHFIAEDVGKDAALSTYNRAGILLKFCRDVQVSSLVVRKRNQTYSAQYGIVLDGVDFIQISSPILGEAQFDGLVFLNTDGDCDYVQVNGGLAYANGRYGVNIIVDAAKTCRRPIVDGVTLDSNVSNGFNVAATGTIQSGLLRARCIGNAGAGACNTTNVVLQISASGAEVTATPLSGISARNGSWFDDGTTLNIRKAGAWTAL